MPLISRLKRRFSSSVMPHPPHASKRFTAHSALFTQFFRGTCFVAFFATLALLSSCGSYEKSVLLQDKTKEKDQQPDTSVFFAERYVFRAGPNDILFISVNSIDPNTAAYLNPAGTQSDASLSPYRSGTLIDDSGRVELAYAGKLEVAGLTLPEINIKVRQALSKYFNQFTVEVRALSFKVAVLGEVANPGVQQVFGGSITILEAIAQAGYLTPFANTQRVKVIRTEKSEVSMTVVDLTDQNVIKSPYYYLHPGDQIVVEPNVTRYGNARNSPLIALLPAISSFAILLQVVYLISRNQ